MTVDIVDHLTITMSSGYNSPSADKIPLDTPMSSPEMVNDDLADDIAKASSAIGVFVGKSPVGTASDSAAGDSAIAEEEESREAGTIKEYNKLEYAKEQALETLVDKDWQDGWNVIIR